MSTTQISTFGSVTSNVGQVNMYRLYCLAGAILVVALRDMVVLENAYDPLWARLVVSGFFAAVLLSSYFVPFVRTHIMSFQGAAVGLLSGWLAWLLWGNHFHQEFMSGYNIMSIVSVLLFDNRRRMFFFTLFAALTLLLATLASMPGPILIWEFFGINLAIFVIGNAVVTARAHTKTKLEIELSHSLTIQEAAIESNTDAILIVDQEGNYIKGNSAFLKMWDLSAGLVKGNHQAATEAKALSLVTDPEKLKRIWSNIEGNLGMGDLEQIAFKDGRMIELYWRPMINGDELIGRLWFFRDITQSWLQEKHLLQIQKRLQKQNEMLLEFASSFASNAGNQEDTFKEITSVSSEMLGVDTVGLWFFDKSSESMRMQLQYNRRLVDYEYDAEVVLSDHSAYFNELFKNRVLAVADTERLDSTAGFSKGLYSGKARALMHAQIRAQGECIGVLSFECAEMKRDWTVEDQNFASSLADLVSISLANEEKQKAQDGLQSSLAVLQAIFDLSETGIIVEDQDHHILNYNELYLKIWEMEKGFIENEPYKVLVEHCLSKLKNSHSYEEGLEKLKLRPGMEYAGIMEFHDGRFVERYSKAIAVGDTIRGRVWFYLDITDRKLKENELINRNFELDSFVYRASHDLKAPLNSIMGLISLIREEEELSAIMAYIQMMDKSVKKLDDFIQQLTQFSQDVRLKVVRKEILFEPMIEDILGDLKFMEHASRLQISVNVVQTGHFFSDPVRLGIVISNLLSNAIKYQDLKKPQAVLKIDIQADEKQAICIFEDNGLGISTEHLEKVFDLFFRASIQATGTGLGLYITHNAIQKLGGSIQVASQVGEGTRFTLTMPSIYEEESRQNEVSAEGEPV